jgi:hypothetical protein
VLVTIAMNLLLGLVGQGPAEDTPAGRLSFMRASLENDEVHATDDPKNVFRLRPDPVLRFNNPVGTVKDGAVFLWLGESGSPVAAAQVFHHKITGNWHQEFSSLTDVPLSAGRLWGPTPAGVEFKPIPGAPAPAATPEQRLRQMRELAREFVAEDAFEKRTTFERLRLLTAPFARYGEPEANVLDGALFAFVNTTDPEVYLLIEARRGKGGYEWHYALAPATIYPVRASLKGREVWSLPYREAWNTRRAPGGGASRPRRAGGRQGRRG